MTRLLFWQEDHPTVHGGAESWLRDTAAGLRLLGHEVAWLYSDQIQQAVDSFRPDVVTIGTIHNFIGLSHAQYLLDQHIPAVWFMHDYWPFCRPRMLMRDHNKSDQGCEAVTGVCADSCHPEKAEVQASRQAILGLVNQFYVITGCEGAAEIMRRNGVGVQAVVEEGIDTELFKPCTGQRDNPEIIYASAAGDEVWKGFHILQQAIQGTNLQLRLLTGMTRPQLAEALSQASIYVFPSVYQEIWGLALTEAMASGCACIASEVAGARAQVHEGTGLLYPSHDVGMLRDTIAYLMTDPEMRAELGAAARAHVAEDHSLIATAKRWERVYAEVTTPVMEAAR